MKNNEWKNVRLKEIANITMGQSPKSSYYNEEGVGMPFMQGRTTFGEKYHTIERYTTKVTRLANKNSVLMSVRAPVGDVNIAVCDLCIGRGLASLEMKNGNNEFLYYLLKANHEYINSGVSGTVFSSINKSGVEELEFNIPDDKTQRKISSILTSIDSKIEINNQINEKLEETAKAIYNEWFVNFNFPDENGLPYKDNGGEFYETELGEIPIGWEVTPLNQVFDFLEGPGIRNWQYTEKGVKFLNIRLIKNNDLDLESANMVSEDEAYGRYKHFLLEENDIIVSTSGTLGKYAVIRKEHLPIMLNTSIIRFRPIEKDYFGFMYQYLKSNSFYKELITKSSGSVQLNFGPTHLKEINIIKPPKYIIDKFNLIVRDFIFKSLKLKSENSILKEVLNLLINKLMQGKINIDELDIDWNNLNKTLKEIEGI